MVYYASLTIVQVAQEVVHQLQLKACQFALYRKRRHPRFTISLEFLCMLLPFLQLFCFFLLLPQSNTLILRTFLSFLDYFRILSLLCFTMWYDINYNHHRNHVFPVRNPFLKVSFRFMFLQKGSIILFSLIQSQHQYFRN